MLWVDHGEVRLTAAVWWLHRMMTSLPGSTSGCVCVTCSMKRIRYRWCWKWCWSTWRCTASTRRASIANRALPTGWKSFTRNWTQVRHQLGFCFFWLLKRHRWADDDFVFRPQLGLPRRLSHPHSDRLGKAVAEGAARPTDDLHTLQRLPACSRWGGRFSLVRSCLCIFVCFWRIDFCCIFLSSDLPEKQEQLHAIYKVLDELPTANYNTLERLVFHLVRQGSSFVWFWSLLLRWDGSLRPVLFVMRVFS